MKRLLIILVILILSTIPVDAQNPKKGLALACGGWAQAKPMTDSSWLMDWNAWGTSFRNYGSAYVPMVRKWADYEQSQGRSGGITTAQLYSLAVTYHNRTWLLGNEPDDWNQDRYTPEEAAYVYGNMGRIIRKADSRSKLILGGIVYGTDYMDKLLAAWPKDVRIDGLQWHDYSWTYDAAGLETFKRQAEEYIAFTKARHPGWEVWITEWGAIGWWSYDVPETQLASYIFEARAWLDSNPKIFRYAYFTWSDPCMGENWPGRALNESQLFIKAYKGN